VRYLSAALLLVFFAQALVAGVQDGETLRKLEREPQKRSKWRNLGEVTKSPFRARRARPKGNLPSFLVRRSNARVGTENRPIRYAELGPINRTLLKVGDTFDCVIEQDLTGYVGSASPVRAKVVSGPHKGAMFIGNATMDPTTKNILVEFSHLRLNKRDLVHSLKATLLSDSGNLGLSGVHHSHYWKYFVANVLSRGAQGYADASIDRQTTIFGGVQQLPTAENATKAAGVGDSSFYN